MVNQTELELKNILEKNGWIVVRTGCSFDELSSKNNKIDREVLRFIFACMEFFGTKGFPDFFVYKDDVKIDVFQQCAFLECKSEKGNLLIDQKNKIDRLNEFLPMYVGIARKLMSEKTKKQEVKEDENGNEERDRTVCV